MSKRKRTSATNEKASNGVIDDFPAAFSSSQTENHMDKTNGSAVVSNPTAAAANDFTKQPTTTTLSFAHLRHEYENKTMQTPTSATAPTAKPEQVAIHNTTQPPFRYINAKPSSTNIEAPDAILINGLLHDRVELLGRGTFGSCYQYEHRPTRQEVAVKIMQRDTNGKNEIAIHQRMIHPNIVRWLHGMQSKSTYFLVMEKCLSSLAEQHRCEQRPMTTVRIRKLFAGAVNGLAYIHRAGYVHRDIKLANLLLSDYYTLKICDFGLATVSDVPSSEMLCGTWSFLAPEVVERRGLIQPPLDVWSMGVCMYLCQNRSHPFATSDRPETIRRIRLGVYKRSLEKRSSFGGAALLRLLERMFVRDPAQRLTAEQVLLDDFFSGDSSNFEMNVLRPPIQYHINLERNRAHAVRLLHYFLVDKGVHLHQAHAENVRDLNFRPVWICDMCSYDPQFDYRMRYNLSNGAIGVFFADRSTMLRAVNARILHFDSNGDFVLNTPKKHTAFFAAVRHQMLAYYDTNADRPGQTVRPAMTIMPCGDDVVVDNFNGPAPKDEVVYVTGFVQTATALLIMLSNRSVQVNIEPLSLLFAPHMTRKIIYDAKYGMLSLKMGRAVELAPGELDDVALKRLATIAQELTAIDIV